MGLLLPTNPLVFHGALRQVEVVGTGSLGLVYRAVDRGGRPVAVKELLPSHPHLAQAREVLLHEARIQTALQHPNIVAAYHLDQDPVSQSLYLTLEWANGSSLAEYLAQRGALGEREAVLVARDVCRALVASWSGQIVHANLKPSNVWLVEDGREQIVQAKLGDFGHAIDPERRRTTGWQATGTTLYMAPEQADGGMCDVRTDLYALGVTLWEALTRLEYKLLAAVNPPDLRSYCPTVSLGLCGIVHRLLQADPRARYQTPQAVFDDLEALDAEGRAGAGRFRRAAVYPTATTYFAESPPSQLAPSMFAQPAQPISLLAESNPRSFAAAPQSTYGSNPAPSRFSWRWLLAGPPLIVELLLWLISPRQALSIGIVVCGALLAFSAVMLMISWVRRTAPGWSERSVSFWHRLINPGWMAQLGPRPDYERIPPKVDWRVVGALSLTLFLVLRVIDQTNAPSPQPPTPPTIVIEQPPQTFGKVPLPPKATNITQGGSYVSNEMSHLYVHNRLSFDVPAESTDLLDSSAVQFYVAELNQRGWVACVPGQSACRQPLPQQTYSDHRIFFEHPQRTTANGPWVVLEMTPEGNTSQKIELSQLSADDQPDTSLDSLFAR